MPTDADIRCEDSATFAGRVGELLLSPLHATGPASCNPSYHAHHTSTEPVGCIGCCCWSRAVTANSVNISIASSACGARMDAVAQVRTLDTTLLILRYPLLDTHIDLAATFRTIERSPIAAIPRLNESYPGHIDLPRARAGGLAGCVKRGLAGSLAIQWFFHCERAMSACKWATRWIIPDSVISRPRPWQRLSQSY